MKLIKLGSIILALSMSILPRLALAEQKQETSSRVSTSVTGEGSGPAKDGEARLLIAQGEGLAKNGRWKKAQDCFLQACSEDPSNKVLLHDLAVTFAHTNQLDQAADCEYKALAVDNNYVPAHIELAWVLNQREDSEGAKAHLKRALQLDPDNKIALNNLQAVMKRIQQRAAGSLARARGLAPGPEAPAAAPEHVPIQQIAAKGKPAAEPARETSVSKALETRGANMYRQGKYDIARRFYEQALENCPASLLARTSLGVVCGSAGDIDREIKEEREVLAQDPKNAVALTNLGWALAQKGMLKEALQNYQKALDSDAHLVEAQSGQGILLYRTGKPEAALAFLRESIGISGEQPLLHLALASVLMGLARQDQALPEFETASRLAPANLEVKARLAAAYLSCDRFEKAADLYRHLVEKSPSNAELRIGLGLALTKNNDSQGACEQFKKAAELDKNSAAAHACLSMIEEMRGRLSEAENEARIAQEKDPKCTFFRESVDRLARSKKESDM